MNAPLHEKQSQICNLESHVSIPLVWESVSFREISEGLRSLEPWQSTRDRCQAVKPGNKWVYICRLFDREWSLGKYELGWLYLSGVSQPHNLLCCFVCPVLHSHEQAIDYHITLILNKSAFSIKVKQKEQRCMKHNQHCQTPHSALNMTWLKHSLLNWCLFSKNICICFLYSWGFLMTQLIWPSLNFYHKKTNQTMHTAAAFAVVLWCDKSWKGREWG